MNDKSIVPAETGELMQIEPADVTPMTLLMQAQQTGADPETLQKYMDLHERWEKAEAEKRFVKAMQKFNKNPPTIYKDRSVDYNTTHFKHASLGQLTTKIKAALAAVGISHRWETTRDDKGLISVTCILTHTAGHSVRDTMYGSADNSGGKNNIQAVGSTITYLQRYTLQSVTGVAIMDNDDDGAGGAPAELIAPHKKAGTQAPRRKSEPDPLNRQSDQPAGKLTDAQIRILRAKCDDLGIREIDLALHFGADTLDQLEAQNINNYLQWISSVNAPD